MFHTHLLRDGKIYSELQTIKLNLIRKEKKTKKPSTDPAIQMEHHWFYITKDETLQPL
jgi:hypothetical protein